MRLFSTNSLVNSFNFLSIADAFVAQQIGESLDIMEKQLFSRVFFAFFILERSRSSCVFFIKKACLPAVRTEPLFRQRLWVSQLFRSCSCFSGA